MFEIDFDDEELKTAEHWHGGQSSMLYAVCSTGSLSLGTRRPQHPDEDRPMTDAEWFARIAWDLSAEAEECVDSARKQVTGKRGAERAELKTDINALLSIAWKATIAAERAEKG